MLAWPKQLEIFLYRNPCDMRLGIDGLCALVRRQGDPLFSGKVFVFVSKQRDRVKLLAWDNGGFVLLYKRLERGRFKLPPPTAERLCLHSYQLALLLDGFDWAKLPAPRLWKAPANL